MIGKPHSIHREIDEKGGGLYSHWAGSLLFSTSDHSDPRRNGRRYSFDLPPDASRLVLLPGLLLLGLIGWRQWRGLAAGLPEIRLAAAGLVACGRATLSDMRYADAELFAMRPVSPWQHILSAATRSAYPRCR